MKNKIIILTVFFLLVGCVIGDKGVVEGILLSQLPSQSESQIMSYVFENAVGEVFVVDGGKEADLEYLMSIIHEKNSQGKIKGWFITHYHNDHTGALSKYLDSGSNSLIIENIYYQFPPKDWVATNEPSRYEDYIKIVTALQLNGFGELKTESKDDVFTYSDFMVRVLRDVDLSIEVNAGNNSSIVYLVETKESSILFLGDLGYEGGEELLQENKELISNMTYVQMAHHGQAGVGEEVYKIINPMYCLWPTPKWLWENKDGIYKTDETKAWIKKLNVKKNYVAEDKLIEIKIK